MAFVHEFLKRKKEEERTSSVPEVFQQDALLVRSPSRISNTAQGTAISIIRASKQYQDTRVENIIAQRVGNPITSQTLTNPQESDFKDIWDAFHLGASGILHKSKQYFRSTLPEIIFKDPGDKPTAEWALNYYRGAVPSSEEQIRQDFEEARKNTTRIRNNFKRQYVNAEKQYQTWLKDHPELQPRKEWEKGAVETIRANPGILKDPAYWGFVAAESAAFTLGVLGTTLAVGAATKNPYAALAAGTASAVPLSSQDLYEDLIENGATEEEAAEIAFVAGPVIASVESAGDIPLLKALGGDVWAGLLRRNIQKEVAKRTIRTMGKKALATAGRIEIAETVEEVLQNSIQNALVKTVNSDRGVLDGIDETIVRTLIATVPFALLGGGASLRGGTDPMADQIAGQDAPQFQVQEPAETLVFGQEPTPAPVEQTTEGEVPTVLEALAQRAQSTKSASQFTSEAIAARLNDEEFKALSIYDGASIADRLGDFYQKVTKVDETETALSTVTGIDPATATEGQQRALLESAVPGTGAFEAGEVYQQKVAGGTRPVIVARRNEDGSVDAFYLGAASDVEADFGISPDSLAPALFSAEQLDRLELLTEAQKGKLKEFLEGVFEVRRGERQEEEAQPPDFLVEAPKRIEDHLDEISPALLEKAEEDWVDNFAEKYGDLADNAQALRNDLKESTRKNVQEKLRKEIIRVEDQMTALEDRFINKYAPDVASERNQDYAGKIAELEDEMNAAYQEKGDAFQQAVAETFTEMDIAEPGSRIFLEDGEVMGISSTFPKWLPEETRSRQLFNSVLKRLFEERLVFPNKKGATKQRLLFTAILDEVDRRTETDTADIRANIVEYYDAIKENRVAEVISRSPQGALLRNAFLEPQAQEVNEALGLTSEEAANIEASVAAVETLEEEQGVSPSGPSFEEADRRLTRTLRGAPGITANDIVSRLPDIELKRDVRATDLQGNKDTIPAGEVLTPYELKGSRVLLQNGEAYLVNKNQYKNIEAQSVKEEANAFAPELDELKETVRGGKDLRSEMDRLLSDEVGQETARDEAILQDAESEIATKYETYQLPGGENYKEILIQAPVEEPIVTEQITWEEVGEGSGILRSVIAEREFGINPEGNRFYVFEQGGLLGMPVRSVEEGKRVVSKLFTKKVSVFNSPHWDEGNVISHIRLNERTYKGADVLFMEELQSDWARQARERGTGLTEEERAEHERLTTIAERGRAPEDVKRRLTELELKESTAVPANPLLKKWQELSIKRALQEAVENRADYFAWITGEQTSARYNLATHLSSVEWSRVGKNKSIILNVQGDKTIDFIVSREGVINAIPDAAPIRLPSDWNGKKLDEVLGKGLADKIMEKETGTLSGEGLRFGGEWAENLYDKQIPNIVKDLTGVKAGVLDMGLPVNPNIKAPFEVVPKKIVDAIESVEGRKPTQEGLLQNTLGELRDRAYQGLEGGRAEFDEIVANAKTKIQTTTQQGIRLTPEVKAIIRGEAPSIGEPSGPIFDLNVEAPLMADPKTEDVAELPGSFRSGQPSDIRGTTRSEAAREREVRERMQSIVTGSEGFGFNAAIPLKERDAAAKRAEARIRIAQESPELLPLVDAVFAAESAEEFVESQKPNIRKLSGPPGLGGGDFAIFREDTSISQVFSTELKAQKYLTNFYNSVVGATEEGEQQNLFIGESGSSGAADGIFRKDYPVKLGGLDKVRPVEFIELVGLARELTGKFPEVKKLKPSKGGFHQATRIVLNKNIFEKGRHDDLAKVLAHEIGHLNDFLPDFTNTRGNLLGRLLTLQKHMKNTFGESEVTNKELREELVAVSEWWRPYDKEASSKSFKAYRNSSSELYADAISVLYNTPGELEARAPVFYKEFFASLDKKPEVKKAFFDLQEVLAEGEESVLNRRDQQLRQMFKKGEDLMRIKEAEREERRKSLSFMLKYELVDKNAKMIDLINKAKKEGRAINDDENPQFYLEEHNYLGGKLKAFLEKNIDPIYKDLRNNEISWDDFGLVMFLNRVVNERGDLANPLGYTPESAQKQFDFLKEQMGDEKFAVIERNVESYRNAVNVVMRQGYESGLYKPDLYQQMLENPAYATFQVLDHLQENIPATIKHQVGTLKEISNPATATLVKTISTIRAIERNNVIKVSKNFLEENHPDEIQPAKKAWNGKSMIPIESKEAHEELVFYMDNGQFEGFYADPYIAESFKNNTTGYNNAVITVLRFMNSKLFRPLFITYNPGFQAFNLIRDFVRAWKNIPGMSLWNLAKLYSKSFKHARARAFGKSDELIQEMEESQILSITYNDIVKGRDKIDAQIDRMMIGYGLTESAPRRNLAMKTIMPVLDFIEKTGNLVETLPKVAGYKALNGTLPPKELGSFVRTRVGSPDFLRRGHGYSWYNEVFLFSNSIKEGYRGDFASATDPRTRSGFWWKTAKLTLVPKMIMFGASLGLFGDFLKECMNKNSDYDKTNYTIIPVGKDESGKCVSIRIPQDETGRIIGGLVWRGLNLPVNGVKPQELTALADYTGGQLPSISPSIEAVGSISQFVSGRNPYDTFRGRNVLRDDEFKAGGKHALIPYLKWQVQQLGGGTIMRFEVHEQTPTKNSLLQIGLNSPVVSNVLGRFIKVSDYGAVERNREIVAEVDQEKARTRLEQNKVINKYVDRFQKSGEGIGAIDKYAQQAAREAFKGQVITKTEDNRFKKKFRVWAIRGENDPNVTSLIYAGSTDAQLALLAEYRDNMALDEFREFFTFIQEQKVISNDTAKKFTSP